VKRAATFGENSPLLSERESIFATHYLSSDNNDQTPRLRAAEGAGDVADLPQDLNTTMEFALPSSPPHVPISLRSLLSPRKSRSSHPEKNVGLGKFTNKPVEDSEGTIHAVRRVASEGQSGKQILQLRVSDTKRAPPTDTQRAAAGTRRMQYVGFESEESSGIVSQNGESPRERGSAMAMRDTFGEASSKERSASRGRTHVDKSIEATLPNRESAKNVRTRKSSHLMGIFKETAPAETKRCDGQSQLVRSSHDEGGSVLPKEVLRTSQLRSKSAFPKPSASLVEEPLRDASSVEITDRVTSEYYTDLLKDAEAATAAALSDTPNSSLSAPVSPSKTEHDPYFRKRDEIKQSMSGQRPEIPAKLLEEIRTRHNLTSTGDRHATLSHPLPPLIGVEQLEQSDQTKDLQAEEGGDHEEEDEEHISSAIYFPHPGPSDEDIEQFISPDEESKAEPFPSLPIPATPTSKVDFKRTLSDKALPEHIDIAVRSKHEKSVFHGDYRPPEELKEEVIEHKAPEAISAPPMDSASSASEISSGEDLSDVSQAEGEVTPTSTPAPQSFLHRRKRAFTAATPKGAVVLEPYSHQVGGHSTMFRFSRRAVCKQLNNRENEFYERIEQRHPDMLRFLPRLVSFNFCSGSGQYCFEPSNQSNDSLEHANCENLFVGISGS
jgi:inositol-hexakisphosphate 5-kinase